MTTPETIGDFARTRVADARAVGVKAPSRKPRLHL